MTGDPISAPTAPSPVRAADTLRAAVRLVADAVDGRDWTEARRLLDSLPAHAAVLAQAITEAEHPAYDPDAALLAWIPAPAGRAWMSRAALLLRAWAGDRRAARKVPRPGIGRVPDPHRPADWITVAEVALDGLESRGLVRRKYSGYVRTAREATP